MTETQSTAILEILKDIQQSDNIIMILLFATTITLLISGLIMLIKKH